MRILLTGGAGFIGSHLAERLLAGGYKLFVIDNFDRYYAPRLKRENIRLALASPNYRLLQGDIRNKSFLDKVFKKYKFDTLIHLAAKAGVRSSLKDPVSYSEVNLNGTINLLETCRKYRINRFIFGSSSSVYGNCKIPYREREQNLKPLSPYGASKLDGEQICSIFHRLYGMEMTIFRFFTVYGPRQRPDMAIHKFTRLICGNQPIQIYGRGDSQRDYTYIDDIVSGILASVKRRFDFQIINLGNSKKVKLRELISILETKLGKKAKLKYLPEEKSEPKVTWADINKASRLLNFKPQTPLEEGIKSFLEWYRHV